MEERLAAKLAERLAGGGGTATAANPSNNTNSDAAAAAPTAGAKAVGGDAARSAASPDPQRSHSQTSGAAAHPRDRYMHPPYGPSHEASATSAAHTIHHGYGSDGYGDVGGPQPHSGEAPTATPSPVRAAEGPSGGARGGSGGHGAPHRSAMSVSQRSTASGIASRQGSVASTTAAAAAARRPNAISATAASRDASGRGTAGGDRSILAAYGYGPAVGGPHPSPQPSQTSVAPQTLSSVVSKTYFQVQKVSARRANFVA